MKTQLTSSHISGFIAQLVRASHRYPKVLNFFQASLKRNCINYIHNCKDHSLFEITGHHTPQDSINDFILQKLNLLVVVDFRFISPLHSCMHNEL